MQGERSTCNSSAETIDLNQGSVTSNDGVNQPTGWYSMVHPIDNHRPIDNHSVRSFGGWHIGESSSSTGSNPRSLGPDGNLKTENSLGSASESEARIGGQLEPSNIILSESVNRPLSLHDSGSTRTPLNLNLNAEHLSNGSEGGRGPLRLLTTDACPYHIGSSGNSRYLVNDDGGFSSSLGEWGSSFKRKALDVGSSNCFHQAESFDRRDFHACHSASSSLSASPTPVNSSSFGHSEELSLRIGIGRGLTSEVFPPIGMREPGETSSRNNGLRINQGSHDFDRFNLPSTRHSVRDSDFYIHHQSSRPISPSDSFEFRPVSSNARTPSQYMHMPTFPSNGAANSGAGDSSSSLMLSVDLGTSSPEEASLPSLTRSSSEHSPFSPASEMRNDSLVSPQNARNSASPLNADWNTPQHGSVRNFPRSSQFYPWTPFPSVNSEPGNWRVHFPPLRSVPSSSEQTFMSSAVNHSHHTPFSRSSALELPGDDASGWHALAAGLEGRQRLVSEIRHVLNAMRRGENLRDEDYMLFDPFINGIAEFHDRHRDMRLDVDNMSYEELLALEERIGDVNTGLTEEAIMKSMQQRKHLYGSSNLEPCSICREDYVLGEDIGKLDCGHDFHTDCIKQWLSQKNLCPICKMTALGT